MMSIRSLLLDSWPKSGHLPLAFIRDCLKHRAQYCGYQLPDHLYISLRITSIKTPMPVIDKINKQEDISVRGFVLPAAARVVHCL